MDKRQLEDFKKTSALAAMEARIKTAADREKAKGRDFYEEIISTLRASAVPRNEIDTLTSALAASTDKNRALARVLTTTSSLASALTKLL